MSATASTLDLLHNVFSLMLSLHFYVWDNQSAGNFICRTRDGTHTWVMFDLFLYKYISQLSLDLFLDT